MKYLWLILILGVGGYFGGVILDGVALDENSKLGNLLTTGTFDDRWIPFTTTPEKLSMLGLLDNPSQGFFVPLISYAQLAEDAQIMISHASISFGIGSVLVDPDGIPRNQDEYIVEGISQCKFHSFEDVPLNTCVSCTLTSVDENGEHVLMAQGQIDLPDGYQASSKLDIPITEFAFEGANDFENVDGVIVQLCDNGLGCTANFWQQEQSQESWPSSISYDETFENIFLRKISNNGLIESQSSTFMEDLSEDTNQRKIKREDLTKTTLLKALSFKGSEKRVFVANAVAALLNAETLDNSFPYTSEEIILMTQNAMDDDQYETATDLLSTANEVECPFLT